MHMTVSRFFCVTIQTPLHKVTAGTKDLLLARAPGPKP